MSYQDLMSVAKHHQIDPSEICFVLANAGGIKPQSSVVESLALLKNKSSREYRKTVSSVIDHYQRPVDLEIAKSGERVSKEDYKKQSSKMKQVVKKFKAKFKAYKTVSYTHLTLPTIYSV